jgi:transposase-like protein
MIQLQKFRTLVDLLTYFTDEQVCKEYLEIIRWEGILECVYPTCRKDKHITKLKSGRYYCPACEGRYSVKTRTIFHDSKIPLRKWYAGIYLITSHKKGISSCQLARDLGVTQKTAWYMNHRVRHSLGLEPEGKLTGIVEADETFMGGLESNKHKSKRTEGTQGRSVVKKTPVAGIVQRDGELRAQVVPDTTGSSLRKFIHENVERGSKLHTDEWWGYRGLEKLFGHSFIKHNENQYVDGDVHTNTMEGFWSLLKRGVVGIYHSMSNKHLQKYVDEFVFRYNTRKFTESDRFNFMLSNMATHLPYKQLIDNGKKEIKWFDTSFINQSLEVKQGSLGFPNENAGGNFQE